MKVQTEIHEGTKRAIDAVPYIMKAVMLAAEETIQAETAGLAMVLGHEAGLKDTTLEFFVNFMALRFPTERSKRYILEWADRITAGTAWAAADNKSRSIMLKLSREMNLKNVPDDDYGLSRRCGRND